MLCLQALCPSVYLGLSVPAMESLLVASLCACVFVCAQTGVLLCVRFPKQMAQHPHQLVGKCNVFYLYFTFFFFTPPLPCTISSTFHSLIVSCKKGSFLPLFLSSHPSTMSLLIPVCQLLPLFVSDLSAEIINWCLNYL